MTTGPAVDGAKAAAEGPPQGLAPQGVPCPGLGQSFCLSKVSRLKSGALDPAALRSPHCPVRSSGRGLGVPEGTFCLFIFLCFFCFF